MEFDVIIVGAGPAGLSTACRLMQKNPDLNVCLLEKGAEIGAHILSGAVFETTALDELFPDWKEREAPVTVQVTDDELHLLLNDQKSISIPHAFVPKATHNNGNYIISLGNLCRWLGEQAEALGVNIFPGFAASELLYDENNTVIGVATIDMGVSKSGEKKASFERGYALYAKYTVLSEGCRGSLGKQLIAKHDLDKDASTQHYAIGLKELWKIPKEQHSPGKVVHSIGWPLGLGKNATGGAFLYHGEDSQVSVGLIVDLSYKNPYLSPFHELQRLKHHPLFAQYLDGGERICYGARAIVKGGIQALPTLSVPGALLVGDDAGFLNFLKIKGSHTAMKSGIIAADTIVTGLSEKPDASQDLQSYRENVEKSWLYTELQTARNAGPAIHRMGTIIGAVFTWFDQSIFRGKLPFTLKDPQPDHATLTHKDYEQPIEYPQPDNKLSFDKMSSVFLSNTNHEEDQPCHLTLKFPDLPLSSNLPNFDEPAQRYCPAGVYEVIKDDNNNYKFQINAQNCVHCKTCDIKDPAMNITWVTPEGGGGPNYPNM